MSQITKQLLAAIQEKNTDRFYLAMMIAMKQEPPIDVNQVTGNGETILTHAMSHFYPPIVSLLASEPTIDVTKKNSLNETPRQVAYKCGVKPGMVEYALKNARMPTTETEAQTDSSSENSPNGDRAERKRPHAVAVSETQSTTVNADDSITTTPRYARNGRIYPKQRHNLVVHRRIHTGERPFKCRMCAQTFTQSGNCISHLLRNHPGVEPYVCEQCPFATRYKRQLKDHMQSCTMEETEKSDTNMGEPLIKMETGE